MEVNASIARVSGPNASTIFRYVQAAGGGERGGPYLRVRLCGGDGCGAHLGGASGGGIACGLACAACFPCRRVDIAQYPLEYTTPRVSAGRAPGRRTWSPTPAPPVSLAAFRARPSHAVYSATMRGAGGLSAYRTSGRCAPERRT